MTTRKALLLSTALASTLCSACGSDSDVGRSTSGPGGAGAPSGGASAGGSGGAGNTGGVPEPTTLAQPGERCAPEGSRACSRSVAVRQLACTGGRWEEAGTCDEGSLCYVGEDAPGTCKEIVAECRGTGEGTRYCQGTDVYECRDVVTVELVDTCAAPTPACHLGGCVECLPDEHRCDGDRPQTCGPLGAWGNDLPCTDQACVDGACVGECAPGAARCTDVVPELCDDTGAWQASAACVGQGCVDGECVGVCAPGGERCAGDAVETCGADGEWAAVACQSGAPYCASAACTSGPPRSCEGLADTCGAGGDEDCCTTLSVPGGTFYRSYDGVTYTDPGFPATISAFELDKFEVTVGRFRKFREAWDAGWRPALGAGKHAHVGGGAGVTGTFGTAEPGLESTYASLPITDADLACANTYSSWTPTAGANETLPINCTSWAAAYVFCVWDGGFLPTATEWNFAAAGGAEQRVYPWSSPSTSTTLGCAEANIDACPAGAVISVGSTSPAGDGRWGHSDLAGNVSEWTLDVPYNDYRTPTCDDCFVSEPSAGAREHRGGSMLLDATSALVSEASYALPQSRLGGVGIRCARSAP